MDQGFYIKLKWKQKWNPLKKYVILNKININLNKVSYNCQGNIPNLVEQLK